MTPVVGSGSNPPGEVLVGIIANPASGTDIRRLVSLGSAFGTQDKINTVQRILAGLDAAGVDQIRMMPDAFGIAQTILTKLPSRLSGLRGKARILEMETTNTPTDSTEAAQRMCDLGARCIVVLGGDGTNRVVAKGCASVPILPISTGTNNVIPYMIEGTVAGLAAGFVARFPELIGQVAYRAKLLEILPDGHDPDIALVDVALVEGEAVGARAVWDPEKLCEVVLTRGGPHATGFSSLAGFYRPIGPVDPLGLWLRLGQPASATVRAPLAPGTITTLAVKETRELAIGDSVTVEGGPRLLALDGEREIPLHVGEAARIRLRQDGPWIVDAFRALSEIAAMGLLVSGQERT